MARWERGPIVDFPDPESDKESESAKSSPRGYVSIEELAPEAGVQIYDI
jgi:hypothetical protein